MTKKGDVQIFDRKATGQRIAKKREAKGISQARLAEKVHASQSIIAKYENGERNIPNELLIRIADELETNADYILRGVEAENIGIIDDLHLDNDSINNLRNYLGSDWIMDLDSAKEAVNFFLSNREGFSTMSQIYAYLFSDCSFIIDNKKQNLQSNSLRIPLNKHLPINNSSAPNISSISYHLSSEDFSDMLLQKIMFNLKQWRAELIKTQKGDK